MKLLLLTLIVSFSAFANTNLEKAQNFAAAFENAQCFGTVQTGVAEEGALLFLQNAQDQAGSWAQSDPQVEISFNMKDVVKKIMYKLRFCQSLEALDAFKAIKKKDVFGAIYEGKDTGDDDSVHYYTLVLGGDVFIEIYEGN
jgi:hypothetical protein